MTKKGNLINRQYMKRENRAYDRSRANELMKAVKLHMWLAKEEIKACVIMLGIGAVCFALMSESLILALFGIVLFLIGMVYHEKALFKLFAVHRYGDASTMIRMMPFDEAVTENAARLIGGGLCFYFIIILFCMVGMILWGIDYGFELGKVFTVLEQLRMLGCEENTYSALFAKLPTELLFAAAEAVCSVLAYECELLLEERKSAEKGIAGHFKRSNAELRSMVWLVLFVGFIVYVYMKALPIPFLIAETLLLAVCGLVLAMIYRELRASENNVTAIGKSSVRKSAKSDVENADNIKYEVGRGDFQGKDWEKIGERCTKHSRRRVFEALIAKKGYIEMPLSNLLSLVLVFYNVYKLTGENSSAYRFIIIAAVAAVCWILISAGKARHRCSEFLFDEYSAFYGMLPLSLKETVWIYTMTTFKRMLPILFLIWGIVTAVMFIPSVCENMREALILLLGEPTIVSGTMGIVLLMLIWLLILIGLAFYLSGQALKIAIEASGSRDPITHKSSRTVAGLGRLV